jgi:hypothetical protein
MDMEALRIVTVDTYIPIYRFRIEPRWKMVLNRGEPSAKVYSPLRQMEKHHFLTVETILRVRDEDYDISMRNRMKERVLVRL